MIHPLGKQLLRFDLPRCKFAEIRTRMPRGILHQDIARKSWINKVEYTYDFSTRRAGRGVANSFLKGREVA